MEGITFDKRFFDSTRGQIVTLLRSAPCTVEELAGKLNLTDNAVRAHLATLERDGLVRQSGLRRGPRKPHFTYVLTDEADKLFPKAADAPGRSDAKLEARVQNALKVLEAIGGAAEVEQHEDKFVIQASGCPLAAAVSVHPEVCRLAETLV